MVWTQKWYAAPFCSEWLLLRNKINIRIYHINKTKPLTKDFLETSIYYVTQSHLVILVIAICQLTVSCMCASWLLVVGQTSYRWLFTGVDLGEWERWLGTTQPPFGKWSLMYPKIDDKNPIKCVLSKFCTINIIIWL